ncbi:PREDICTED: uncharacterized protein LOC107187897 isoform X2 [Dufourea novaeangliae]|uniref:uncharacterized protein LOC107187897 isoform X2 n=1 Tax=Dufourea novaeangliae TaxID=178035 RepID=UPI0007675DFC|nr:PREDICTED: uncharacterized protein LOC107187897 isoform X2 [Dufourea novaeangliae]
MRDEIAMYALKPIVSLSDTLHRTKTMYEMRNIHEERSRDDHTEAVKEIVPDITEQSPLPEYDALEARQEKILAQIAELKTQVSTLCDLLKQPNHITVVNENDESQELVNMNLIINVNPKMPPYSALALQQVWNDIDIKLQNYVHSSINEKVPLIHQPVIHSPRNNVINLSVIWKNVEDLELVSGLYGSPVNGETNFLRYISRLINAHNYENSDCLENVNRIDTILDLCHSIHFQSTLKKKQDVLSLIADKLDRNSFGKKEPDIADIAVWSTIKQNFPKCPPKLEKWFEAFEKCFNQ